MLNEMLHALSKLDNGNLENSEIKALITKKVGTGVSRPSEARSYWQAKSFDLENVTVFKNLSLEDQKEVLILCSQMRLEEAYYIEYAGMSYAAKMSLLAKTVEEQKLYSMFAAEEARHFNYINQFFTPVEGAPVKPFIRLLNDAIAKGERMPLIFIIQVLLEGWGIDHYQKMSALCLDDTLKTYLSEIVNDEAAHHGSGVILFNEDELSALEFEFIINIVTHFLEDVRIGPDSLVSLLTTVSGTLSPADKKTLYLELDAHDETQRKLTLLKKMMEKVGAKRIVKELESKNLFTPAFT
ncbi:MAG: ferritin-like domain-containing protein [Bacteriovoracaceae bacterium]|nr:ferritin-like domain-containing protein [Bacteriovoracaceae bacterium]